MSRQPLIPQLQAAFPELWSDSSAIESPEDSNYNCIAFAAGETHRWWEPALGAPGGYYWPPEATAALTLEAFREAFQSIGYKPTGSSAVQRRYERVAIFVDAAGSPKHAARQQPDGSWLSKLGESFDIRHETLEAVSGPAYGTVGLLMRRRRGERLIRRLTRLFRRQRT
jgi:hypothetical protein